MKATDLGRTFAICALLAGPIAQAHEPAATKGAASESIDRAAEAAVRVVDAFSDAMRQGDLQRAGQLLAPDLVVLESGGVERSKAEYMAGHGPADAAFLKTVHVQPKGRTARAVGNLAWVASESELHMQRDGKPSVSLSTETMVLKKAGGDWRIVHIHWSSRTRKP